MSEKQMQQKLEPKRKLALNRETMLALTDADSNNPGAAVAASSVRDCLTLNFTCCREN